MAYQTKSTARGHVLRSRGQYLCLLLRQGIFHTALVVEETDDLRLATIVPLDGGLSSLIEPHQVEALQRDRPDLVYLPVTVERVVTRVTEHAAA
jgi:hypothetical protein